MIDGAGSLADQPLSHSVWCLQVAPVGGFRRDELHRCALHSLGDRLCITEVVLLSFRVGPHILRRHQPVIRRATTNSGRERNPAQSAATILGRHGCRWVAASVVLVTPRRLGTIIAGAAPNPRRHPIATNKPSTSAAGDRPLPHTAPHKLLAQVEHPAGRSRLLVAVHGLALRSASDAIRAPLTELLKPDGCRAPPRSSHRAAGARQHQRRALRAHGKCVRVRSTPPPSPNC